MKTEIVDTVVTLAITALAISLAIAFQGLANAGNLTETLDY